MSLIRISFLAACLGHILCRHCDSLLAYTPNGRFDFGSLNDNQKLAALFAGTPREPALKSILFGVLAMTVELFGYLGICAWIQPYAPRCALILLLSAGTTFISGVVHHVFCGVVEWFYLRFGCTEEARQGILEFFKKTSATMVVCVVAMVIFAVTLFAAVILGWTPLPRWACIFNLLPLFVVLAPFRIVGTMNIVGALMFAGLFVLV